MQSNAYAVKAVNKLFPLDVAIDSFSRNLDSGMRDAFSSKFFGFNRIALRSGFGARVAPFLYG